MTARRGGGPGRAMVAGMLALLVPAAVLALEPAEQLQFADGLFSRGMFDDAVKEYQSFLQRNPDHTAEAPSVYFKMGEAWRSLGRTNEADQSYRQACEASTGEFHYRAALRRAEIVEQAGDRAGQLRILRAMLAESPPAELGAAARYALGGALEKEGDAAGAAEAYEGVLASSKSTPYASYAALALAGLDKKAGGRRSAALYREAAERATSPRVGAEAWFQLGDFEFSLKHYDQSIEAYEKLTRLYPGDERVPQAQLQRAWALYDAHRTAEALAICEAGTKADATRAEWLYLKANAERQLLKNGAAVQTYADLLAQAGAGQWAASAAYERALVLFKMGRYQEAIDQARGLLDQDRVKRDVCWLLAEASSALHDEAGAVQYYRLLVDRYPDSPLAGDALFRLASQLQGKGDLVPAAELFGRLATDFPAHELAAQALFAQAYCLGRAARNEQAVAAYARLLARYPASPYVEDALFQKATLETYLRRDTTALETWRDLQTKFPSTRYAADARFWNGVLLEEAGKLEDAEGAFRAALRSVPAPGEDLARRIRFRLALVLQRRGGKESSGPVLDEAADLLMELLATPMREKFNPALQEWLGEHQLARHDFTGARGVADRLVATAANDEWRQIGWCLKGKALMGMGQDAEARQAFDSVTSLPPRSPSVAEAWLKLGDLALKSDAGQARKAYEQAATLAASDEMLPVRVQAYAGIARALKSQGDQAGAARHFMSVAVLFDDAVLVPECLYEAAQALAACGRSEEAGKARTELLERYPASVWARRIK